MEQPLLTKTDGPEPTPPAASSRTPETDRPRTTCTPGGGAMEFPVGDDVGGGGGPVAGAPALPATTALRFRTPCRRWATLSAVFTLTCLASGPVTSWQTFEPILGARGVLGSTANHSSDAMNEVYNIGQGVSLVLGLPMGVLFDVLGPSYVAAVGGVASVVGLASMAVSITKRSLNWMLFWAYPLAVFGGGLTSYSVFGFTWIFPAHQTLVGSLNMASIAISDSFALIGVWLNETFGVSLVVFFVALAVTSGVTSFGACVLSPSRKQAQAYFRAAMGTVTDTGGSEVAKSLRTEMHRAWKLVCQCAQVMRLHPVASVLMQLHLCAWYMSVMYPALVMFNLWVSLVGVTEATGLVDLFPIVFGTFGALFSIVGGGLCDRVGVVRFVQGGFLVQLATSVLMLIPTVNGQRVWMIVWCAYFSGYTVVFLRFSARYAPFELFGSYMGVLSTLMALPQFLLGNSLDVAMALVYPEDSDSRRYTVIITVLNALSMLSTVALLAWWCRYPPPIPGQVQLDGETGELVKLSVEAVIGGGGGETIGEGVAGVAAAAVVDGFDTDTASEGATSVKPAKSGSGVDDVLRSEATTPHSMASTTMTLDGDEFVL